MSHNQMSEKSMGMFAEGLTNNTRLTDFFFTHNDLQECGNAGLALIKCLANKTNLKSLALNSCNLNGKYLEALDTAISSHTELKELYLFANKIEEDGAGFISNIIASKENLQCLGLSNNKLGATGAVEIAEKGLKGKTELIKLSIENNGICNAGVESISKNLSQCNSFQEIYLYNNDIDDDPIDMFVEFIQR
jgi:Ran GTPase-activating protein (RanGAP) involved in mRNA processing and transport